MGLQTTGGGKQQREPKKSEEECVVLASPVERTRGVFEPVVGTSRVAQTVANWPPQKGHSQVAAAESGDIGAVSASSSRLSPGPLLSLPASSSAPDEKKPAKPAALSTPRPLQLPLPLRQQLQQQQQPSQAVVPGSSDLAAQAAAAVAAAAAAVAAVAAKAPLFPDHSVHAPSLPAAAATVAEDVCRGPGGDSVVGLGTATSIKWLHKDPSTEKKPEDVKPVRRRAPKAGGA